MNTFKAERVYTKRETEKSDWFGRIGSTTLTVASTADIDVRLDDTPLPRQSVEYLLNFALQSMQDAYAGADSLSVAIGAFEKKRDAIINGTLGMRGGGDGVSQFVTVARSVTKTKLRAKYGKDSAEWGAFKNMNEATQNETLDKIFTKNETKIRPDVEAEIERRRIDAETKRAIAADSDLDV